VLRAPLDFPLPNIKQKAFIDMMDFKLAIDINLKNFRKSQSSIATLPPFGPIEGQKWFFQISSL
jgi:hypothetical protein